MSQTFEQIISEHLLNIKERRLQLSGIQIKNGKVVGLGVDLTSLKTRSLFWDELRSFSPK